MEPDAKLLVQSPTPPLLGALLASQGFAWHVAAVSVPAAHDDGPLGEGRLHGYAIQCPRHGAQFDIRTGEVLSMPAVVPIATFPVQEQDGKVLVSVPQVGGETADSGNDW